MSKISIEIKQTKLSELSNLITQYENGETEKINISEYPLWIKISEMLRVADIEENIYEDFLANPYHYIISENEIIYNENWRQEEIEKREADFNKQFFSTSLGYIRRKVTMQFSDEIKDFLSDLLPTISMGVSAGTEVKILAYEKPSFDEDVEDWTKYQKQVIVTPAFIQECFAQLQADFGVLNAQRSI